MPVGYRRWHARWVRCVIVDDNEFFLTEACALLQREGIDVVGVATNRDEALRVITRLRPHVTLVDIDLGDESGFELVRALVGQPMRLTSRVIFISAYAQADFADLIDASPAAGFVAKAQLSARAIRAVLNGEPPPEEG